MLIQKMVKNGQKMVKNGKKKNWVFSDKFFRIGRDPPPFLTESKKKQFFMPPLSLRLTELSWTAENNQKKIIS